MASYNSPFEPSGSLYGATFVKGTENRRAHIRQRSSLDRDKWLRAKAFEGARAAAVEFGGAAMLAATIYRQLGPIKDLCNAYTHNHLAQVLRQAALDAAPAHPRTIGAPIVPTRHRIPHFDSTQIAAALQGLQLGRAGKTPRSFPRNQKRKAQALNAARSTNKNSPSKLGNPAGQTPIVAPDRISITGTDGQYTIHGIKAQAAQMPTLQPNQRYQFKVHIAWAAVPNLELPEVLLKQNVNMPQYSIQQIPHQAEGQYLGSSDWMNPDHLPDDIQHPAHPGASTGLQLGTIQFPELPNAPDGLPIITFVAIEWRLLHGMRPTKLKSFSTVTIAELLEYRSGKVTHLEHAFRRRARRPRRTRPAARPALIAPLTPAERIQRALAKISLRE